MTASEREAQAALAYAYRTYPNKAWDPHLMAAREDFQAGAKWQREAAAADLSRLGKIEERAKAHITDHAPYRKPGDDCAGCEVSRDILKGVADDA